MIFVQAAETKKLVRRQTSMSVHEKFPDDCEAIEVNAGTIKREHPSKSSAGKFFCICFLVKPKH